MEGKLISCIDFALRGEELVETVRERRFGNERNKLVIQPMGVLVLEFLLKHFGRLFQYEYTKKMEDDLDLIAKQEKVWHSLCSVCDKEITDLSSKIEKGHREIIKIDEEHEYMIGKYGPVIRKRKGEDTSFLSVRKDIDLDKLREGGYNLGDLVVDGESGGLGRDLGEYNNNQVMLKKGKYGKYISCNGQNYSVKHLKKPLDKIKLGDVIDILEGKKSGNPNVLRILRDNLSLRKGKWGPYLFYKTDKMKKPRFLKIKKCDLNVMKCELGDLLEWVEREYQI